MRIAINTRFLLKGKMEGFGWFTYESVKRMVMDHPEHTFIFFFDRPYDSQYVFAKNVIPIVLRPPARHPILFKIWFNYSITRALKKHKADVFLSPDGYLSLRTNVPQIGVIHDLNFEHYPEDLPKPARDYLQRYFPLFAKKAKHLLTVSEYSKQDIVDTYGVEPKKITVAHNGGSEKFAPINPAVREQIRKEYTGGKPYFICVGALHPRKNINRLLLAFDTFKTETDSEVQLLIVGAPLFKGSGPYETLDKLTHKSAVHFSGHVDFNQLTLLMGSALALTFVSYFEGFGIPMVEAMRAETPILAGNLTSLPEVGGDAAIYVDPFDISSIKDGLIRIATDEDLRNKLIESGRERAKNFTWDRSAAIIWNTIIDQTN